MAILLKKQKLQNGIITDLYVKMHYYKANSKGIQCVCSVYANLDERKVYNTIYSKKYYELPSPENSKVKDMNTETMWDYVYNKLTEKLGGTREDTYSDGSVEVINTQLT